MKTRAVELWAMTAVFLAVGCDGITSNPNGDELTASAASLTIDTTTPYWITGVASGKCLQPVGGSRAALARIQLATCDGSPVQQFQFTALSSSYYSIKNVASGLCLDVEGRQTKNGAAVIQYSCSGATNQQFAMQSASGGGISVTARHSGKRLDVSGQVTTDGANIVQWAATGSTSQAFLLATAGTRTDGGAPVDGGAAVDGGPWSDGGAPTDGGSFDGGTFDGGRPVDGGAPIDGGTFDGGRPVDGGAPIDGGTFDGGRPVDGGAPTDGGTFDGGRPVDGGSPSDGGIAIDGGLASSCASPQTRVTEVYVGTTVVANEDEAALRPIAISPIPSGGSRVAFMGNDGQAHIVTLKPDDTIDPAVVPVVLPVNDFADLFADERGGVLLATRDAQGGGTLNCGNPANLCGTPPSPPIPCYDMYLVRFDGSTERWATKLTSSSAALPPYSTGPAGPESFMIWWYAHHGRIASDGINYAAYFGSALSVSQSGCINIHQGDRMQVVGPSGSLLSGHDSFDWGCSHSGYERIVWDPRSGKFVTVCKTDNGNRITFAPSMQATISPVDLSYSNLGNLALAPDAGYWLISSNLRSGQPAGANGLADVHLLHFSTGAADKDLVLASEVGLNDRAPHLAPYGATHLLAAWETSPSTGDLDERDANRKLYVQALDATSGAKVSSPIQVQAKGNRYQDLRPFPDGSVAYVSVGNSTTTLKIVRVLACQ